MELSLTGGYMAEAPKVKNEHCTLCGKDLGYPDNLHVNHSLRMENYVEGSGQKCTDCAIKEHLNKPETHPSFKAIDDLWDR